MSRDSDPKNSASVPNRIFKKLRVKICMHCKVYLSSMKEPQVLHLHKRYGLV